MPETIARHMSPTAESAQARSARSPARWARGVWCAGTVWFAIALFSVAANGVWAVAAIGAVVLAILMAMMWTARETPRHGRHETFEVVHRYGGWTRWRS